jgi:hypothetical protein
MAIHTLQLDRPAGTSQIALQVHRVVQFHGPLIDPAGSQNSEFWMCLIEPTDIGDEPWRRILVLARQIGVALRARAIAGVRQMHHTFMLDVAIRAGRYERLLGMMDWTIVTSQASLIGGSSLKASLGHVARTTLLSDQ